MQLRAGAFGLVLGLWAGTVFAAEEVAPGPPLADAESAAERSADEAPAPQALAEYDPLFDDEEFGEDFDDGSAGDPLEGLNRQVFAFNEFLDTWAFDPLTRAYQFVTPELLRRGLHNFFLNLQTPVVFANHVLQLRPGDAAITLGRFVINTTAGGVGLFDAAGRGAGLDRVDADFGQTLAVWGVPNGPFLMLPVLGPSTVRDVTGDVIDRALDPLTYFIGPVQWWIPIGLSQGLATREANMRELEALRAASLDFYSALRSAYLQSREADVRAARGESREPEAFAEAP